MRMGAAVCGLRLLGLLVSLLALLLALPAGAAAESYNESLRLRALPGGCLLYTSPSPRDRG